MIAMTLSLSPERIIADEPTRPLDATVQAEGAVVEIGEAAPNRDLRMMTHADLLHLGHSRISVILCPFDP